MVDAEKNKESYKKEINAAAKELPDFDENMLLMLRYFYTTETLTGDIMEYASTEFQKEFGELDVMNVAIFTLHGIVTAASCDDIDVKNAVKCKLSGMIDEKYFTLHILTTGS